MKTISLANFNASRTMPSITGIMSRNPDLVRRLDRMTGHRIPALRMANRRNAMNQSMPWIIGAGAVALLGAGLGLASRMFGRRNMMSRTNGGVLVEERSYAISEQYPAGAASAGSVATPGRTAKRR